MNTFFYQRLILVLILLSAAQFIWAQCNDQIFAGEDFYICGADGETQINLNGGISGDWISFEWRPTYLVDNTQLINTTATISGSTTFELVGLFATDNNLITNPGFEDGLEGYSNDPSYSTGYFDNGTIRVTNGGGANGSDTYLFQNTHCPGTFPAGSLIAGQTLTNIIPDVEYEVCFWIFNANQITTALIEVRLDNQALGTGAGGATNVWVEHCFNWTAGNVTSAFLGLYNLTGACVGNDFGIDELQLNEVCQASDEVTIHLDHLELIIDEPELLNCNTTVVDLIASHDSTDPDLETEWIDENGNVIDINETSTTVSEAGTYTINVYNPISDCTYTQDIQVQFDTMHPTVEASGPFEIVCEGSTFLDASHVLTGEDVIYNWSTSNGNFTADVDVLNPEVDQAGEYILTLTDTINGCTAAASFLVEANVELPEVDAFAEGILDCTNSSVILNGMGSSEGDEFIYSWTTADGMILNGENSLAPEVGAAGEYILHVINTSNSCENQISIFVEENREMPELNAADAPVLNCNSIEGELNVSTNLNGPYIVEWKNESGETISNELDISVDQAGTYTVVITNEENGCSNSLEIMVTEDFEIPVLDAGPNGILTCTETSLVLQASANGDGGGNFNYQWNTDGGNFIDGQNTLSPTINGAGTYTLIVTNVDNGCSNSDELIIDQDDEIPFAEAGTAEEFNCNVSQINLDASNSSNGPMFIYEWSTDDGQILNGENSLNPLVSATGTYFLTVTNTENNCTAVSSVDVSENFEEPVIELNIPDEINCNHFSVVLENLLSPQNDNVEVLWEGPDEQTYVVEIIEILIPGVYTLTLTDLESGCTSSQSVEVIEDFSVPSISLSDDQLLSCDDVEVGLQVEVDPALSNLEIVWGTSNGNIISDFQSSNIIVDQAGSYIVSVTNLDNGCVSEGEINVGQSVELPEITIEDAESLDCITNSIELNGNVVGNDSDYEFLWSTIDGNIISGSTNLNPLVDAAGTYQLEVTNLNNGCSNVTQISVDENLNVPLSSVNVDDELNCSVSSVVITSDQQANSNVNFEWTTSSGNIISASNDHFIEVDQAGTYELLITYLDNGCTNGFVVNVEENLLAPSFSIGEPDILNCDQGTVVLAADVDAGLANMEVLWNTQDGNIISSEDELNITVDEPGIYILDVVDLDNGCSKQQSIEVFENSALPDFEIIDPLQLNCEIRALELALEIEGDAAGFLFLWSSPDGNISSGMNGPNPFIDAAGTYTLTITDPINGCSSSRSILVEEDLSGPVFDLAPAEIITCDDQTVQLTTDGSDIPDGYVYTWTTLDGEILGDVNQEAIEAAAPGTYQLNILNPVTACESAAEIIVEENVDAPQFNLIAPPILDCNHEVALLEVELIEPDLLYSYLWESSNGNIISENDILEASVDAPGTYQLTMTNLENGCTQTYFVEVQQDIAIPLADAGADQILNCETMTLQLDGGSSSEGNEFEYVWTSTEGNILAGENTLSPLVDDSGEYILTVLNSINGCSASSTVIVELDITEPEINIVEPMILNCSRKITNLNALIEDVGNSVEINWQTIDGSIVSSFNTEEIEVDAPGVYQIIVKNLENGCESTAEVEVIQDIEIPELDAGVADDLTCALNEIMLNATADEGPQFIYTWSSFDGHILSGANGLNPIVSESGTYELLVVNTENDCQNSDFVFVGRYDNIPFDLEAEVTEPLCHGELGSVSISAVLGGDGPYLYSIDGGNNFSSQNDFQNLPTGNYSIMIQDANECLLEQEIFIPNVPEINAQLVPEVEIFLGENYELNPILSNIPEDEIASVTWTPSEGLSCSDCLNPEASPKQETLYSMEITTLNGCTSTAQILLRIDREVGIYIPNAFSPFVEDGINDVFMIYAAEDSVANISEFQVYDRWGNKLFERKDFLPNDPSNGWDGTFRGKRQNNGVFIYYAVIEFLDGRRELFKGDVSLLN